jgi:hypothetical protein
MKFIFKIIIFLLPIVTYSQGFDWQVSSRSPYEITNTYIGAVSSFSYSYHTGNFPFLEEDVICCTYEDGIGTDFQLGVTSEYWHQPDMAFTVGLLYSNVSTNFYTETTVTKKTNPDLPGFDWTTAYESDISLSYITLDLGVKNRIYSKLNLKAGVDLNFNIGSSESHLNSVVTPSNIPFSDGSFEKELINGRIKELSPIVLGISIGGSYDIDLGIERYGEISILTRYTVNSLISDDSWRNVQAKLMLKAFIGVK